MTPEKNKTLLARQSILNKSQQLYGYELLFRPGFYDSADIIDDVDATLNVITNAFFSMGLDRVLGGVHGFINISQPLLMTCCVELLPADRIHLELPSSLVIDQDFVARCKHLKERGYHLVLDNFIYSTRYDVLLPYIEMVKIDMQALDRKEVAAMLQMRQAWPDLKFLAGKVETFDHYDFCRKLGFDYFQGFFFSKPFILSTQPGKFHDEVLASATP